MINSMKIESNNKRSTHGKEGENKKIQLKKGADYLMDLIFASLAPITYGHPQIGQSFIFDIYRLQLTFEPLRILNEIIQDANEEKKDLWISFKIYQKRTTALTLIC